MIRLYSPDLLAGLSQTSIAALSLAIPQTPRMQRVESDDTSTVIPIIVGKQYGGKYDDHAVAIGIQIGTVFGVLGLQTEDVYATYVYPEVSEQLDLIALEAGYTMTESPCPVDDEMITLTFTRNEMEIPDYVI